MKTKIYIFLNLFCGLPLFLLAQQDMQTSIFTDDGIFTVSQTPEGKDMIFCNIEIWDKMVKGTKYTADNLSVSQAYKICFQITNKKQMHCKAGIGFSCGIFDCFNESKGPGAIVDHTNRICPVIIQKNAGKTVTIIFLKKIDWISLQNNN